MFPRSLRLSRTGFEQSRRLPRTTTTHFSISSGVLPNAAGIGIIVPKKVAKKAVDRHALKRRVREIVRGLLRNTDTSRMTFVLFSRTGATDLSFDELTIELSQAFKDILAKTPQS